MQLSIQLSSTLRIALVILVIASVVLAIHLLTRSEKLRARTLSLLCVAALLVGWACLFALSRGEPDPHTLEGFEPFDAQQLSAAGDALEDAAALEFLDAANAAGARLSAIDISFRDGKFSHMDFTAVFSGGEDSWKRNIDVTEDGQVVAGGRSLVEADAALPALSDIAGALARLEEANWTEALGIDASAGSLTLALAPSTASAAAECGYTLAGSEITAGAVIESDDICAVLNIVSGDGAMVDVLIVL